MLNAIKASLLLVGLTAQAAIPPAALAQVATTGQITGTWEEDSGGLKLEMFDAGGSYAGRLVYAATLVEADGKTFKKDTKNPDPKLRSRSLQGVVILKNLKWHAGNRRWEGGTLYDGASGRSYSARVTLKGGKMEMRGYMGSPMLGRTVTFHRVTS